jgi:lysozyme family protein
MMNNSNSLRPFKTCAFVYENVVEQGRAYISALSQHKIPWFNVTMIFSRFCSVNPNPRHSLIKIHI